MGILNIREAVRAGSKVVIGIAGPSGSGKTYTALKLARGMVKSPSEIGFLDTENRRGSLYADILDGKFLIGDLFAPFSPDRYRQAIEEFQAAGVKVLVIDSASHEWEGDGGCEEIAATGVKVANWKLAKSKHKKFMSGLLQCDMHVIVCIRAREKTSFTNPKEPQSLGMQPICEKNFMFEMTASMMMWNEGLNQQFLKMPEALRSVFGSGDNYLSEAHGEALINWVNSGAVIDKDLEHWRARLQMKTNDGLEKLKAEYLLMPKPIMAKMKEYWPQLEASAKEFDAINSMEENPEKALEQELSTEAKFDPSKLAARQPERQPDPVKEESAAQPIEGF